ncbi:MarR family winged helix-turn-helix transcriptional regulator [Cupriavidus sp. 2TAF22]|uniref:MarR family winged helix-turn-helix transcriptional regulator n=1 Tax=unclassified Cupriavidus TaxID=2640874 RepID=UPI003F8FEE0E
MNAPHSDSDTAHALAAELRVVLGKLTRRLREKSHFSHLSWTQLRVLLRLERDGPATVSALARAEGMRPQSMGETVSALKSAGLVSGAPDPTDGRQTVLSLTPACVEAVRAGRAAREDWLFHAIETKLAPAEQEQLAGVVGLLARLVES